MAPYQRPLFIYALLCSKFRLISTRVRPSGVKKFFHVFPFSYIYLPIITGFTDIRPKSPHSRHSLWTVCGSGLDKAEFRSKESRSSTYGDDLTDGGSSRGFRVLSTRTRNVKPIRISSNHFADVCGRTASEIQMHLATR